MQFTNYDRFPQNKKSVIESIGILLHKSLVAFLTYSYQTVPYF
jgi:hypothetical protein